MNLLVIHKIHLHITKQERRLTNSTTSRTYLAMRLRER